MSPPAASKDGAGKTGKKPVETWKPSRLAANTSRLMVGDNEELPLRGMQVDVRIDGFRARVVLDLYYFNDQPRQLEGNFQLRLPEEASPYFFAFGRTVYQARQVAAGRFDVLQARAGVRGGHDAGADSGPAPRELGGAEGRPHGTPRKRRPSPIARRSAAASIRRWSNGPGRACSSAASSPWPRNRCTAWSIGYDVDLLRAGDDLELRLDLPRTNAGLRRRFQHRRASRPNRSASTPRRTSRPTASGFPIGWSIPSERPLVVRLREPATTMLVGGDGKTGSYFAVRGGGAAAARPAGDAGTPTWFLPRQGEQGGDLLGRYVAERRAAVPAVDEAHAGGAGEQPRPDRAVRRALLQRRDLLVAREVRGEHAGERRGADEVRRRAGAGRGHRPRPGARRSRLAVVAEEGRRAAAGDVPAERRRGHVGRRPLGDSWPRR